MSHEPYVNTSYLHCMLDPREFQRRVPIAKQVLAKHDYDSFAFRGMSGALLAAPLANMLDKTMIMVRKPKVDCHTSRAVEGDSAARRYVIVDDTVCSGNTIRKIIRAVKRFAPEAECVGLLIWNDLHSTTHELESAERFKPNPEERFGEFGSDHEAPSVLFKTIQEENNAKAKVSDQQLDTQASQAVLPQAATLNSAIRKGRLRSASQRSKQKTRIVTNADRFREFTRNKYKEARA